MRIASWNVNSLRTRLEHLSNWLADNPVDALCLQETKVVDGDFPQSVLEDLGYHCAFVGQKSYNGVAILSRQPLTDVRLGFGGVLPAASVGDLDDQKRVISGVLNGVRLVNLYVPNGSSPDSDKYSYKLRWLTLLRQYLTALQAEAEPVSVCGDFNIALEDRDIYVPGKDDHIMATPMERQALRDNVLSLGFRDAFRLFSEAEDAFSWWDYRQAGFQRNRGWRIDHHYISEPLRERAIACTIDREPRGWEKPSDHAPVILELAD